MSTKVDLSSFNNHWYQAGGNVMKRLLWYFCNAIILNSSLLPVNSLKVNILRWFGTRIGKGVVIKPKVNIKYPWKLTIGDHVWLGENTWIDNLAQVTIGNNVCISQGAYLFCGNHNYKKPGFDLMVSPIYLKNGSWVGAKATVCPGVTLNENSILTVSSTATSDLEANGIYQGVPAKKIKERVVESI